MLEKLQKSARRESKLLVQGMMLNEINNAVAVHPQRFFREFPNRIINNIYFDNHLLSNFHDNVNGASERIKLRLRWYGDSLSLVKKPVFEVKIKKNMDGWKIQEPLDLEMDLASETHASVSQKVQDALPKEIREFLRQQPVPTLINNYERQYFRTNDGIFRLTVDSNMAYYNQSYYDKPNFSFNNEVGPHDIIEVKVEREFADDMGKVTQFLPFRITKSSKYVTGVESSLGM
ncbi:MAG: polyphosphate polymerase domain-containing protein [SAR324 cluster bacterium]|nr:polyphosphate polymerase domain-containing protein [SAR324 cluster bacterium]